LVPGNRQYWIDLSRRITGALRSSSDDQLRFLAIDDIVVEWRPPANSRLFHAAVYVLGNAPESGAKYEFELELPRAESDMQTTDWDALLKRPISASMVHFDHQARTLRLAVLDTDGPNEVINRSAPKTC
jgi:hypothetical protein